MPLDPLADLRRRLDQMERLLATNPLENASVTSGRIRIIGGLLRVDSGGRVEIVGALDVDGTTSITGPTTVTGTFDIAGPTSVTGALTIEGDTSITGPLDVTGTTHLGGTTTIDGDTTIDGNTSLEGNLDVTNGGRITVGDVELNSTYSDPRIRLGEAYVSSATGSAITLGYGASAAYLIDNTIRLAGMPTKTSAATGLPAGAVYADTAGKLWRVV